VKIRASSDTSEREQRKENAINDICLLVTLIDLEAPNLASNPLIDLTLITKLPKLRFLQLVKMSITDITAFRDLPDSLRFLNLLYNQITDISPLVQNPHLGHGDEIYLSNNPLRTISIDEYIPQLEARGVKITYE